MNPGSFQIRPLAEILILGAQSHFKLIDFRDELLGSGC